MNNPTPVMQDDKELDNLLTWNIDGHKEPVIFKPELKKALIAWRDKSVVAAEAGLKSYVDKYPDMTLKEYWDGKHQKQAYKAATLTKEEGAL